MKLKIGGCVADSYHSSSFYENEQGPGEKVRDPGPFAPTGRLQYFCDRAGSNPVRSSNENLVSSEAGALTAAEILVRFQAVEPCLHR